MILTVKCPMCGEHQSVPTTAANSVMQCITCGRRFRIPAVHARPQPTVPLASLTTPASFGAPEQEGLGLPGIVWVAFAGAAAVALLCIVMLVAMLRPQSDTQAIAHADTTADRTQPPPFAPLPNNKPASQSPSPPIEAATPNGRAVPTPAGLPPPTAAPPQTSVPSSPASPTAPAPSSAPEVVASGPPRTAPKRTSAPTYAPPSENEKEVAWGVKPDPAPNAKWLLRRLELKEGHLETFLFSRAPATMAVAHCWQHGERVGRGASPTCKHWLDVYDVKNGSHIKNLPLEPATSSADYELLAVAPEGKQALVKARKRDGNQSDWLQLLDLATGEVALEWEPVAGHILSNAAAAFLDAERVLLAHKEQLAIWEVKTQTPTPLAPATCFAVSPNGKFIVAGAPDRLAFFEATNGEPCGELLCRGKPAALAFSAAGDRLAALTAGTVTTLECWNLEDGSVTADFPVGLKYFFLRGRHPLQWCGREHVLLDGKWLIDLTRGLAVWRYRASKILEAPPDERCWYTDHVTIRKRSIEMLFVLSIPEVVAKQRIERIYSQARQIVGPGSQISLKLSLPQVANMPDYAQRVQQLFTDQLAESNITVAEGQPVVLEVSAVQAATGETHTFKPFFGGQKDANQTQVAGQKVEWRTAVSAGGRVYWERTGTSHNVGFMSMAHLKPGETLDQNLTKQMWDGTLFFFKNLGMPGRVFDVESGDGFGESRLTAAGAEAHLPIEYP